MPFYTCTICEKKVNVAEHDLKKHEMRDFECPACYSVIAARKFEYQPGTTTLFSSHGQALGDQVIFSVIQDRYLKMCPDENVIFLDESLLPEVAQKKYSYAKYFWSDVQKWEDEVPDGVIWFKTTNEADAFSARGYYPFMWVNEENPGIEIDSPIVIHARHVEKDGWKNLNGNVLNALMGYFKDDQVILLGNDKKFSNEILTPNVIDLRNELGMGEIVYILNRARLFLGKDSGMAHVAGTCTTKMICWGYKVRSFFPKTRNTRVFLHEQQSSLDKIFEAIERI